MNAAGTLGIEWLQLALQIIVVVLGPLLGWLMKSIFDKIKDLERVDRDLAKAINDLAIALPTNYPTKTDIASQLDNIYAALRRIEEQLGKKQDKHQS